MNTMMVWTFIGAGLYGIGYLTVGMMTNYIWKLWAWHKVGQFWDYSIRKGMPVYYPGVWYFVQEYNGLYSVIRVIFWPVMIPVQLTLQTKVLNRLANCRYY